MKEHSPSPSMKTRNRNNIIIAKDEIEKEYLVKSTLNNVHAYYYDHHLSVLGWPLDVFWDVIDFVGILYANRNFVHQTWFQAYHLFLFKDLLHSLKENYVWLTQVQRTSRHMSSTFVWEQLDKIRIKAINPLDRLRQRAFNKPKPSWK